MEANSPSLRATLQTARKSKRLSQLELALRMGVSQRHVSFVESGRAQPSRELLLAWLHELQAPLALRNVALQQAGFAPVYRGSELGDAVLAPVREALGRLLAAHDPMPAMVMDAAWNVLQMNRGAQWMAVTLMPWIAQLPPSTPINLLDAMLHPEGMTRHMTNLEEVAPALLAHLRDDASVVPELLPRVEQFAAQVQQRIGKRSLSLGRDRWRPCSPRVLPRPTVSWLSSACSLRLARRKTSRWPHCVWNMCLRLMRPRVRWCWRICGDGAAGADGYLSFDPSTCIAPHLHPRAMH
jgi:transcriptional regulator with XRE-family HTH domain